MSNFGTDRRISDDDAKAIERFVNQGCWPSFNVRNQILGLLADRASDIAEIARLKAELEHWKQLYDSAGAQL